MARANRVLATLLQRTMADTSQYKVGIVISVETKTVSGKKTLKACSVSIGGDEPITVVTSASNVREGSRYDTLL